MYIERKAYSKTLKDLIADSDGRTNYEKGYIQGLATANGILLDKNQTPTADVVEVVRCKDCVHRNPNCYKCMRDNLWHDKYDFCSYGERKESEVTE